MSFQLGNPDALISLEALRHFLQKEGIGVGHVQAITERAKERGSEGLFALSSIPYVIGDQELERRFTERAMSGELYEMTRRALRA